MTFNSLMFSQLRRTSIRSCARRISTKPAKYGQPIFQSHPHLVKQNELTPGIPSEEYEQRRQKLMKLLPDNSVIVSVAAPVKYMSGNIFYKYRQASDFWYLTGIEESDSALILEKNSSSKGYRMTLFSYGKDPCREKWEGPRTSFKDAESIFQADEALIISTFGSRLKSILNLYSHVYVDLPQSHPTTSSRRNSKSILNYLSSPIRRDFDTLLDNISGSRRRALTPIIAKLRTVKSEAEQEVMRAAADISGRAHAKTMCYARPGMSEGSLAAHFEYICALNGAQRPAYVPVVASGSNALMIHYTSNNHIVEQDELVLIDAGCEYNGYASDITRTFPVSGKFTDPQRDLYSAVLSAQKQLVMLCSEKSNISLHDLHQQSATALRKELNQIGFRLGVENDLESVLYPHYLGHPIGIDLHESLHFDRRAPLKAGNVITIEPGIYVPPTANFPKHYHNIGIRIEDEILIGKDHPVVLSVAAPKEIEDIEGACQGALGFEPY